MKMKKITVPYNVIKFNMLKIDSYQKRLLIKKFLKLIFLKHIRKIIKILSDKLLEFLSDNFF